MPVRNFSEPAVRALGDVSGTALATLFCRARESERDHAIVVDPLSIELANALRPPLARSDTPLHRRLAEGRIADRFVLYVALRTRHFDRTVREFLQRHPHGVVLNLGCGLDTLAQRLNPSPVIVVDVDVPPIIALKRRLVPATEGHRMLAASVLDFGWMNSPELPADRPTLLLAEGLLMYLPAERVRELLCALLRRFPGAELLAEVFNSWWLENGRAEATHRWLREEMGFGPEARFVSGVRAAEELAGMASGLQVLGEWCHLDEPEPRLGSLRKLRHFPLFRRKQWVVRCRLN